MNFFGADLEFDAERGRERAFSWRVNESERLGNKYGAPYLLDERQEISSGAELQDEPDVVPRLVPVVELEDVGAAEAVDDLGGARRRKTQTSKN